MSYKTIIANVQDPDHAAQVIDFATELAISQDAHLVGLFVVPAFQPVAMYGPAPVALATEIIDAQRKHYAEIGEQLEERFTSAASAAGVIFEWRTANAENTTLASAVVQHARGADLAVVGQPDPDSEWQVFSDIAEGLLMDSGRPVIVVPYAGSFSATAKTVMLAWNGSREAARAAFDALPILQGADQVKILSVNPETMPGMSGFTPGDDIAASLSRHGVKTEAALSINPTISIGDELLSRAADGGSHLLVMGGYGHSRMIETLFGGATHYILRHMTLPVLISH